MSQKRSDLVYLESILEAIDKIEFHRSSNAPEATQRDAIIYNLATIGEAANKISAPIRKEYKEVPWRDIIGHRNVLIHNYLGVNHKIVWSIVETQLPTLKRHISKIIMDVKHVEQQ